MRLAVPISLSQLEPLLAVQAASANIQSVNEIERADGSSYIDRSGGGTAYSFGGHGIYASDNTGILTAVNIIATGNRAGSAFVNGSNSLAYATGGSGIFAVNTDVQIEGGTYTGSDGGGAFVSTEDASNLAIADGGSGVFALENSVTINGGTFSGGRAGSASGPIAYARAGRGVWTVDANLTITDDNTNTTTTINDGIYFENTSGDTRTLTIKGGEIVGDIDIESENVLDVTTLSISTQCFLFGSIPPDKRHR